MYLNNKERTSVFYHVTLEYTRTRSLPRLT